MSLIWWLFSYVSRRVVVIGFVYPMWVVVNGGARACSNNNNNNMTMTTTGGRGISFDDQR